MPSLIDEFLDDTGPPPSYRKTQLINACSPALRALIKERKLNRLEAATLAVIALATKEEWDDGASAVDIALVLKVRTADVAEQLQWLERKDLVRLELGKDGDDELDERWFLTRSAEWHAWRAPS